jgi:two-component system LytT family sensor kinase
VEYKIPIEDLYKYSFKFSLFIMLTAFVSIYVMENDLRIILFRTVMAFAHFYGCFLINIYLYRVLSRKQKEFDERVKFIYGILLTIIFISISTTTSQWLMEMNWISKDLNKGPINEIYNSWKIYIFIPFLATVIFTTVHFFHRFVILAHATKQSELEVVRLQSANTETTNQLLKQQIQPHFLFNALNTLKTLIKKQPDVAENYLIQLSDFLRASLSGHRTDTVSIKEELKLCDNYMDMQRIRFGEALKYEVNIPESYLNQYVIPFFSLQPLLENAIKHNELTKQSPLVIQLLVIDDRVIVKNNLKLKKNVETSTGNGLTNLKERYRILFQEKIQIEQTDDYFLVSLKLIPNENSSN